MVYYNEVDNFAAFWLRELMKAGVIADGVVDPRPIQEVEPSDLEGFTQCHFFAGIGVWSYALRLAGWPDDRQVWTGSCPCQPFSVSGKKKGFTDDRHLWPDWENLIAFGRPSVVFGEQVASKDGLAWLDLVQDNLEAQGYAFAPFDLCAAGVGAPHIRQRFFFVADTDDAGLQGWRREELSERADQRIVGTGGDTGKLAHCSTDGRREECADTRRIVERDRAEGRTAGLESSGGSCVLADTADQRHDGRRTSEARGGTIEPERSRDVGSRMADPDGGQSGDGDLQRSGRHGFESTHATTGFWSPADWIFCRDGKYRPVEPGTFPLAHGAPCRVGRLRGYGNAINAEVAATFINAYLDLGRMSE